MKDIKVVLVDDNELMSDMVQRILVRNNYTVFSCQDLENAQNIINTRSPAIIIITADSFEEEIYSFLKLNKSQNSPGKYLMISSSDNEVEMLKAGADDWLRKPYKLTVLLTRLEVMCRDLI